MVKKAFKFAFSFRFICKKKNFKRVNKVRYHISGYSFQIIAPMLVDT